MIKNNWGRVFSVGIYIELHIVDSSCGYTVLWDYLSLGSDNHPPVSLLSSSFLLPCLTLFSWGWCLGEASKNSSGEKASSLQQHGDACQLASLLGYPSSVPLVVTSCSSLDDELFFYKLLSFIWSPGNSSWLQKYGRLRSFHNSDYFIFVLVAFQPLHYSDYIKSCCSLLFTPVHYSVYIKSCSCDV